MIDIKDILCALEVAKEKSITKAAANLFLTQSAVSQKISRTENDLGLTLFERNNRSVSLTEDGEFFVEHAAKMMEEWNGFLAKMNHRAETETKYLTIGMHALAVYSDLPELVSAFTASHPDWKVNFSTHGNDAEMLRSQNIDFFFLFSSIDPIASNLTSAQISLQDDVLHILLHKDDSLSKNHMVTSDELSGYHLISWNSDLLHSFPKELNLTLTVCDDSFLPAMLTKPGIFTLTPKSRCAKILQRYPDLVSLPFQFGGQIPALTLYLLYKSGKINPEKHPFVKFVKEYYMK
ncbi:MAG: LysR family transcriptional regulator [Emergencia sp.]|nr:LysR family transcriptional regulator [Emergencia sp.]